MVSQTILSQHGSLPSLKVEGTTNLWGGNGLGRLAAISVREELHALLESSIGLAWNFKQARNASRNTSALLKSLSQRGILTSEELPRYDPDDLVGLTGEVLLKEFSSFLGYESIYAKWETNGTSKSKGIDLVARKQTGTPAVALFEAKHLHQSVNGKMPIECYSPIRSKFREGLEGFDLDDTSINLAAIICKLDSNLELQRAVGGLDRRMEEIRNLLSNTLSNESYSLEVMACIDGKYCDGGTLNASLSGVVYPPNLGTHRAGLSVLRGEFLHDETEGICKKYA
jgi:hypothetical protein